MAWYEIVIFCLFIIVAALWLVFVTLDQLKVNKPYREALNTITAKLPGIEAAINHLANKLNR